MLRRKLISATGRCPPRTAVKGMAMAEVIMTKGLPGSGKSTWARSQVDANPGQYKRVNKDDLRAMLDNGQWSKKNERFILHVRDTTIRAALERNYDVIVDDTNLSPKHEAHIRRMVDEINAETGSQHRVAIKDFTDVPLETCIARDAMRTDPVGEHVIRGMYNQFLKPPTEPASVPAKSDRRGLPRWLRLLRRLWTRG